MAAVKTGTSAMDLYWIKEVMENIYWRAHETQIARAVISMDSWLDTMRGPDGYTGPVVHWWQDCLFFTGAGLDWRYEGIILGYLNLYRRTGASIWLEKACRAGNDLTNGQTPEGFYRNSNFELNPYPAGTPHEAACDLALIQLAQALREAGSSGWEIYSNTAKNNLECCLIPHLWNAQHRYFKNELDDPAFVPNKAATLVEALVSWDAFSGRENYLDQYAIPTLDGMIECQVASPGHALHGAISQSSIDGIPDGRYFPFYIARCLPALISGFHMTGQERYLASASAAFDFLLGCRLEDGSFPQVIYSNGRRNIYPRWVAGTGDILRAMDSMQQYGKDVDLEPTLTWLLSGMLPSGGVRTADGFSRLSLLRNNTSLPNFRDLVPVCGWVDKAFRFLSEVVPSAWQLDHINNLDVEMDCEFWGRRMCYHESTEVIEVLHQKNPVFRWEKGSPWSEVCAC